MKTPKTLIAGFTTALCFTAVVAASEPVDARSAFARLSAMNGTWVGAAEGAGAAADESHSAVHEFAPSAGGSVVMERMNPGTAHEMINMYHLDGDDLVLTHYCSGGNQPRMRLDRGASSGDHFVFRFDGGTNLGPGDPHIHSAELRWEPDGGLASSWTAFDGGERVAEMTFSLHRQGPR